MNQSTILHRWLWHKFWKFIFCQNLNFFISPKCSEECKNHIWKQLDSNPNLFLSNILIVNHLTTRIAKTYENCYAFNNHSPYWWKIPELKIHMLKLNIRNILIIPHTIAKTTQVLWYLCSSGSNLYLCDYNSAILGTYPLTASIQGTNIHIFIPKVFS
jgi:hypothetical protein